MLSHGRVGFRVSFSALVLLALALAMSPSLASAQQLVYKLPPSTTAELDKLLEQGKQLEGQRRWGEALTLYEEAARKNPGQIVLEERLELSRINYDLARRYADTSFRNSLLKLSETEALELYNQVLTRIAAHSVNTPDYKALLQRGGNDLSVALGDATFTEAHLRGRSAPQIRQFRNDALKLSQQNVRDRSDAKVILQQIARSGQQQLGISSTAVILEYVAGAVGALDEYSNFLTGGQLHDLYSQIDGNFVGLGVELKTTNNQLQIVSVITNSPAERGGIMANDIILEVDGQLTSKLTADKAADMLQGLEGTTVNLTLQAPNAAPRKIGLRREQVEVPSVDNAKILDATAGLAYFKLSAFQKTTATDIDRALWALHRQGMKSLIIDLRGNPGGLLTASVEAADRFLESGTIVSTRGRNPQEDFTYTAQSAGTWKLPLVVLIDGDSASASEIFAGAMRDHRRATIIGMRSYGKGSVQGIFPLNIAGTGIRLTTAKFYSPLGKAYSKVGVEPTIEVRQVAKPVIAENTVTNPAVGPQLTLEPTAAAPILAQVGDADKKADSDDPVIAAALQTLRRHIASTGNASR
jgi:carboxyl-terminal processing protease